MLVIGAAFPGEGWKDKAVLKEQERMRVNRWYGVEQHAGSGSVYGGGGRLWLCLDTRFARTLKEK